MNKDILNRDFGVSKHGGLNIEVAPPIKVCVWYLFSPEQKYDTQGLTVCLSDGDWYMSSEKHVNKSFNNSVLRERERELT